MESDLVLQSQDLANKPALETNQMHNKAAAFNVWRIQRVTLFFHRKKMLEQEVEGNEQHFELLGKRLALPHK